MNKARPKKLLITVALILVVICIFLIIYPQIEFRKGSKLFVCQYSENFGEFEKNPSYNELYFYNEKRDISIKSFNIKKFLFFYVLELGFVEGDARETQYILEEEYITNWLKNAVITDNPDNIDVAKLIEGKTAIVSNKRYNNDEKQSIFYELDGKYDEMYIFYVDDLLVIQVGSPDENPKYIAYK